MITPISLSAMLQLCSPKRRQQVAGEWLISRNLYNPVAEYGLPAWSEQGKTLADFTGQYTGE